MKVVIAAIVTCAFGIATAGPKLFVLRANSSTDLETRKHVEAGVLGLARNIDRGVGMSDTTFTELSSAVGCTGDLDKCKQPILEAMAIDEVVDITIAPAGTDSVTVTVRRAGKSGPTRTATAVVGKADPDPALIAGIGPLFGATKIIDGVKKQPKAPQGTVTTGPVVVDNEDPLAKKPASRPEPKPEPAAKPEPKPAAKPAPKPETKPEPKPSATAATTDAKSAPARTADSTVTAAPDGAVDDSPRSDRPRGGRERKYLGGMIGGGAIALIGVVLWQKAGSIEDDAAAAPDRTRADIDRLLDLESRGDRYALWGNISFVAGVAIAGTCTVLYIRQRGRTRDAQARLAPVVMPGGGGLALTLEVP